MQRHAAVSFCSLAGALTLLAVFAVGCNGGSSTAPPISSGSTATPSPSPVPLPASASATLSVGTSAASASLGPVLGGYSAGITVDEHFVLAINHAEKDLAAVAPLLCAGITTWSPLKHWGAGPGKKVGIVGIGGLGHMGVKLSHALGAHTVAFTTSPDKALNE